MAAVYRDRLRALTFIQGNQAINAAGLPDADIFALAAEGSTVCIQAFFIRGGQNWGHRSFFPAHTSNVEIDEVFSSFLMQFYDQMPPPKLVLLDRELPDAELLAEALSTQADYRVNLLELDAVPDRIEIYDNSHIQGTNMVGGMVVAGPEGFRKNAYRKFNIKNPAIAPGDDFAMMREVLERRFARAQKEDPDRDKGEWPDLVLIDGGKGQMSAARQALAEIGVEDVVMIGVSKGPDRNAGRETFHLPDGRMVNLPPNSPVLFYLQRLRDEAHRFAIGAHRTRRAKAVGHSSLDDVPGIGPARKKALLLHFGTARAVKNASLDDLQGAPGVSATVAQKIYDFFHG